MDIHQNLGQFLENYGNPFIVGSLSPMKVLYVNKIAQETFGMDAETCDLSKIFDQSNQHLESVITNSIEDGKNKLLFNLIANTATQEKIVVDLQFGFFDKEKSELYLEIIPRSDTRMEMALNQIHNSPRAEAVLNLDEQLSIVDYNKTFGEIFDLDDDCRSSDIKVDFFSRFAQEIGNKLISDIHETMKTSEIYSTNVKVFTAKEEKWYRFDLQKRELDHSGTKLMCSMINIEKQVQVEEENSMLNQYLATIQQSTVDLLYRVDIKNDIMYHFSDFVSAYEGEKVIRNHASVFQESNTIHPDDKEIYFENLKKFYEEDILSEIPVRFSLDGKDYQWYKIMATKIFGADGELKEVFGALVNVDKETVIQDELSALHKHLDVFQSISSESICIIDLQEKTLKQTGVVAKQLGLDEVTKNFPECVYQLVYPDDLQNFKAFIEEALEGDIMSVQSRLKDINGEYQWYEICTQGIIDRNGKVTELLGRICNIQKKKTMETEISLLTQYFDTMQSLSGESIYVFDIESRLLQLGGLTETELGLPLVLEDYPECLFHLTHPMDLENFITFAGRALSTYESSVQLRFKNIDGTYQWYELLSNIIYSKNGKPFKILGKIRNIEAEKTIQAEVSTLSKYFDVMQEFCSDILYRIDVQTQTLYHAYHTERTLKIGSVIPNYLETFVTEEIVHPDDAEAYMNNTKAWLLDDSVECEARFNLIKDEYELYSVKRRKIYDDNGNLVEILGALVSVQKERDLARSNQHFKIMQELSEDIFYRVDVDTMTLHHNLDSSQEITKRKAIPDYVNTFIKEKIIHPDDIGQYLKDLEAFNQGSLMDITARFALISDEYHWYKARARKIYDEDGNVVEFWGRLISEQEVKKVQLELQEISQYFSAMQKLSDDILFHIDIATETFSHSNQNALDFGLPSQMTNFVEVFIEQGFVPEEDAVRYREYINKLYAGENIEHKVRFAVGPGTFEWFVIRCEFIMDSSGDPSEIFGSIKNIHKQLELEKRATLDVRTSVLNIQTFETRVKHELDNKENSTNHALLFLDMDDFKFVNDNFGHQFGDFVLEVFAKRVNNCIRETDIIGRLGGDEFVLYLKGIFDESMALDRANTILERLKTPIANEKFSHTQSASIGIALIPTSGINYEDLYHRADKAVYHSKRIGKNVASVYKEEFETESQD